MEEKKNTMENMTKEHLTEVQKYKVLNRTSFKNVSGNWQFNGAMTPERFIKILFTVLEESGSVAAPKRVCPKCGSGKVIMFTSDDDLCQTCGATFPGVLNGSSELASLRQQLKEREEALKELLPIAERKFNGISIDDAASHREYIALKAIIERARKLLSK